VCPRPQKIFEFGTLKWHILALKGHATARSKARFVDIHYIYKK